MAKAFFKNADEISENLDVTKYMLRETFKKEIPLAILNRKKKGFPVPLDIWFKGKFVQYAKNILLDKKARTKKILDQKKLKRWIDLNLRDKSDGKFGQRLWTLLNIEIWLREYF